MARQKERVILTKMGKQTISLDKILYFPRGLMGFEDSHEFTLLQVKEDSPFLVLQCVHNPRLGLLVADPYSFTEDYEVRFGEAEQKILKIQNIRQVAVLVTVTIPQEQPEKTALNLTGPILVNYSARIGLQVPQIESKYPSQIYLHEQEPEE